MARGWESKSIEAQQEEASGGKSPDKTRLTREETNRRNRLESLQLSLRRIVDQIQCSRSDQHRQMLEQARTDLEHKIGALCTLPDSTKTIS
jgi:molecular chaperone DnaK (HSP70)